MLARFRTADHEFAAEEFLIVQFLHRSFRLFDGLHLHKGETLGALVVPVTYDLGVLHVADAIEQVEEIALCCIEGQIADVEPRRSYFDRFRFACGPRLLLRTVARCSGRLPCAFAVSKKCSEPLPECFLGRFRGLARMTRPAIASLSRTAPRTSRASPG
jgi:hypothetical protein